MGIDHGLQPATGEFCDAADAGTVDELAAARGDGEVGLHDTSVRGPGRALPRISLDHRPNPADFSDCSLAVANWWVKVNLRLSLVPAGGDVAPSGIFVSLLDLFATKVLRVAEGQERLLDIPPGVHHPGHDRHDDRRTLSRPFVAALSISVTEQ